MSHTWLGAQPLETAQRSAQTAEGEQMHAPDAFQHPPQGKPTEGARELGAGPAATLIPEASTQDSSSDELKDVLKTLEALEIGYWTHHLPTGVSFWSEAMFRLMGFSPNAVLPSFERWIEQVYPEDRERVMTGELQPLQHFEFRVLHPDGRLVWHSNRFQTLFDETGKPYLLRGLVKDITAQRDTEDKAERLAMVAARTQNAVIITDAQARIEWVNEGFERLTGYNREEVLGRSPGDFLQGPGTDPHEIRRIGEAIRQGQAFKAELVNYRRSGQPYWVQLETQPLLNPLGHITGYMAIESDTTGLRVSAQQSSIMQRVAALLLSADSVQAAAQGVVDELIQFLGIRVAQFYQVVSDYKPLQHVAAAASPAQNTAGQVYIELSRQLIFARGLALVAGIGGPGMAWGTAQLLKLHSDMLVDGTPLKQRSRRRELWDNLGVSALIFCPVQVHQRVMGVLEIGSSTHYPGFESLPRLMEQISAQLAQFMLRQNERLRFESIFEHSPEAMLLVDIQGKVTAANARAIALFGTPLEASLFCLVEPADALLSPVTDSSPTARRTSVEGRGFGPAGRIFPSSSFSARITHLNLDFIIVSVRDLSEQRRMEETLAREQASLRHLKQLHRTVEGFIQSSPTPLLEVNSRGRVVRSNVAARRLLQWNGEQELHLSACLNHEALKALEQLPPHASLDVELFSLEGHTLPVEVRSSPLESIEGSSLLISLTDLTERKRVEQAMITAQKEAQASAQAKSQFLANMSHEIRTPLNAVLGLSQLALQRQIEPELKRYFEKIHGAAQGLLGLISDILDFSKIEAGMLTVERVEFSLEEVIYAALDLVALKAEQKGVELLCMIDQNLPARMLGDPLRISQILRNLLSNAVKFTSRGEIEVSAQLLHTHGQELRVELSVRDTGPGMAPETVAGLFQPFVQGDASSTRLHEGTGLGLAICKQLAGLLGGEIALQSQLEQGTQVCVRLPFFKRGEGERERFRRLPSRLRALKALVVEDSPASQQRIKHLLESLSLEVILAGSAEAALAQLATLPNEALVVFVDMSLPDMPGLAFQKQLASLRPDVPVLMMVTSSEELAEHPDLLHSLRKPLRSSEVMDTLMKVLGDAHPHRNLSGSSEVRRFDGLRILLVEDNDINQEIACELLRARGVQVTVASHGAEALRLLQLPTPAGNPPFDLILMDIQMPVMDGLSTTRAIRALPNSNVARLPIVAMTAHAMSGDREKSLAAGMNDHLTKPLSFDELERTLTRWRPPTGTPHAAGRPLFQADACLKRVAGNRALLVKLLNRFLAERSGCVEQLRSHLPEDRLGAMHLAHTLRGVTANLGMELLADTFTELEKALKSGQSGQVQLHRLEEELTATLEAVRQWLRASATMQEGSKPEGTVAELRAILNPLQNAIRHRQGAACLGGAQKLGERSWPLLQMPLVQELSRALTRGHFDTANSLWTLLMEELADG